MKNIKRTQTLTNSYRFQSVSDNFELNHFKKKTKEGKPLT